MEQKVILVDESDQEVGSIGKLEAHRKALLHRAFSVFVFNSKGEMLLQQRASNKYHCAGLWTNACCSHPAPGEDTAIAARRRLQEELGFVTDLSKIFDFTYKVKFDNGLTEYEFDHVYTGTHDDLIVPNKDEVRDYCYKSLDEIESSLQMHSQKYTPWFLLAFPRVQQWAREHFVEPAVA